MTDLSKPAPRPFAPQEAHALRQLVATLEAQGRITSERGDAWRSYIRDNQQSPFMPFAPGG